MMYNRYIPDAQGVFHATQVQTQPDRPEQAPALPPQQEAAVTCPAPVELPPAVPPPRGGLLERLLPRSLDTGELLLVLIVLLLLVDSGDDDSLPGLLAAAAVLLF